MSQQAATQEQASWWRVFRSLGPGLVTACVVIGPGSILTSSKVGAAEGYSKVWVVVLAVVFMMTYTSMAARLGVVTQESTSGLIARRIGRWLAVLIGLGVFFISAAFQFGNNLGVHSALTTYIRFDYWVVLFNALTLAFLFGFENLYRAVERLMAFFVGVMLLAFALNLYLARPHLGQLARGFLPLEGISELGLPLLGLVGTTFVISAAYYQSYLVRFRGWQVENLKTGLIDARVGSVIMLVITVMIMSTAAAVLRGRELEDVGQVAQQLYPLFGEKGRAIFCVGLFSAAFSSFLVNSMIGGFILADSLGLGDTPTHRWPRIFTAAVLLSGMGVALFVIKTGTRPVGAIVAAQAVTVLAAPLMAFALLWLANSRELMGKYRNGFWSNLLGGLGFVTLLGMAWYTAVYKVWPAIQQWFQA